MSALRCRFWLLVSTIALWIVGLGAKEIRIVCYYTNWSVYRPGDAKFNPQNINPYLCTHLIYAFGGFTKENTLKPFDKYQDVEKGGYAKFVGLKTYNKNLKTMLAIGGWNEGSTRFSPMVASAERRKELVKNTIKFLRQNHFDGLDLDWEYPSFRDGGKPRDRGNYARLVQEMREEFDRESEKTGRPRLLLTMAVPAGIEYINKGYDIPKLNEYLDWMNILSYDYHSAYEPAVNHHSPLYPVEEENEYSLDIDLNVDYTIKHYLENGADKSKLVLGIPTYGRSYTLYNPDANEIGSPADGPGEMGDATRENGYLAFYEICEKLKSDDWEIESPYPDAMGPYAYNNDQWVGYDDEDIARKKAEYVAKNGLGGIMFWSIDNDDFRGKCGERPYPIIEAAKEALLKAYGLTDANLLATTKKPIKTRTKTRGTTRTATATTEAPSTVRSRPNSRRKNVNRVNGDEVKPGAKRRISGRRNKKKPESTTSVSSLVVTPSYTTPAPPSTPDSGGDFKCEDEGFFPHPKDCKKYFWCLSGPSELGIVAHQFTCPAGLYFNKAAASCDYTQNVLCNKKLTKTATTTTTTTSLPPTSSFSSTRRPPPKITAATSRTTVTTTEPPEEEDEYEEYDDDVEEAAKESGKDAEQDPKVIKDLIELIKKAGGIEELEKQLQISVGSGGSESSIVDATTRSSINKSLYEKVLGRATATLNEEKKKTVFKTYNTIGRNSRGPQNEGLEQSRETPSRGRLQYTSIVRSRPSTEAFDVKPVYEEDQEEENVERPAVFRPPYKKNQLEYVTIRRQRITTTTETSEADNPESQFKQLGESEVPNEEGDSRFRSSTMPSPYVTIRRSRPTAEPSENNETPQSESNADNSTQPPEYVTLKRQGPNAVEQNTTTSRYFEIPDRGTTTPAPIQTTSTSEEIKEEKPSITIDESANSVEENIVENTDSNVTEQSVSTNSNNSNDTLRDVVDNIKEIINSQKQEEQNGKIPVLSDPRPFSLNSRIRSSTTTEEIPKDVKVSVSSPRNVLRNKILEARIPPSSKNVNNQELNTDDEKNNDVLEDDEKPNRFSARHRFSTETSKDESQVIRIRGRGQSRFTAQTVATTTIRNRPIAKITETPYTDYETIEYNRKYRPDIVAEISDLSSLLAVDFKDLQSRRKPGRRRRPVIQTTTASSVTTEASSTTTELDENQKNGSKTVPLARKLLDGALFGRANKFRSTTTASPITTKTTSTTETQPKNEEVSERSIKTFRKPIAKTPNFFDGSRLNRFRKASINTTAETVSSTPPTIRSFPTRRRVVLRKLIKPISRTISTTTSATTSTTASTTPIITSTTTQITTTTTTTEKEEPTATTENQTSLPAENQTTSIPENQQVTLLTESQETSLIENQNATKENEEVAANKQKTTTSTTEKENTTLPNEVLETTFSSREKDEIDDDKSEEADDNEEGENIKLSESIVRENSQNFGNIIREGLKPGKLSEDKSFKSAGKDIIFDERPSTEPSFFVRTRKIIRKLSTTESPILSTESDGPKFKKVVRRLKLTTASGNNLNGDEKPVEASTTSLLHKGRRRFGITPTGIDYVEGENDEENERKKYGFRRPTTPNGEDDYEKEEFGIRKKIEAEKSPDDQTFKSIKPTFKLNRPLFRRRKIGTASKPDEKRSENEEIRPLFGRRKYGSSTFRPIQDESKILNINKALYNRRIPTFTVYSTTSTPTPSSTAESTISNETENDSTITTEAATETAEETKTEPTSDEKIETVSTESASNDRTEIISSTPTSEESTLEDLTTVDGNKEIETMVKANTTAIPGNEETTEQATLKPSNESSTLNYTSTRYGEVSNTTSLPLSTRRGKLYFKNKTYGTNSNALGNGEEDRQVKKLISTTESALSKLLRKRKGYNKITTQEETKPREETQKAIENKEEAKEKEEQEERAKEEKEVFKRRKGYNKGIALQENIKSITEEEDGEAKEKEGQEQRTKEKEEKEEEQDWKTEEYTTTSGGNQTESDVSKEHSTTTANINGEEESTLITEATTMLQDETERAIEEFATTIEDLLTKIDSSTEMEELATKIEDLSTETEDFSTNTDYVSTKTEELSTTEDLPTITTDPTKEETITTTTEYVSTTTTTRKPSRLFRPIALRPKFTGRFKPSELSTTLTPTISSTERFKPNKFNKFAKLKPTPKRFTSSSTTENEDLGYGPIKEIKSAFRPNLYHPRNKFTPEKEQVNEEVVGEQEEEEIDSDDYVEEDTTEVGEKQHPRPSLFSKPGYKPSYIILKPSSNADEEIAGEHEEGPNQEEKTEGDTEDKTVSSANPSNVYFSSTSKPSTRQYKKFTTASPATVAQNLSDVNITAVNQRNRNLFNKTRKMNTPFVGVTSKVETNKTTDNSYLLSLLTSTKQDDATEKVTTTTERATTLHHIFAESDNPDETTLIYNPIDETTEKKVEKIIEINRIVKVTAKVKNGANVIETETDDKPEKVDRLLVSRVTEIKVVEGENGTHRQEKKYETRAKNDNDVITSAKKMSSKPFYSVETATIPLEGLFQTSPPKVDLQNELLEGENSNYVNVRVLQQDSPNKLSRMATNAKFVPVRLLKDEDEITMKADVVEVTPSASNQQIKIVPISVSIQTT